MFLLKRMGSAYRGIKAHDWALLSLETLCLIAGILIAFELNEWAASRNEARRHAMLMERLFEESENDVSFIRNMRDLLSEDREREKAFASELSEGQCPSDESFQALNTLSRYPALTAPTSVYQELMGAGGLSSIERRDVRDALTLFHTNFAWTQKQVDFFRAGRVVPVDDDDQRRRSRFDPTKDEPGIVNFDRRALCNDPTFHNKVVSATRNHVVFVSWFEEMLKDAINMCVKLGDSLGKTCVPKLGGPLRGEDADFAADTLAKMKSEKRAN